MVELSVVTPDGLDFEAYTQLQREAFADVIGGSGMEDLQSESLYRWKYSTPYGQAKIATVRDGGMLVAANAMYPLAVATPDTRIPAWQSCDTATHPSARGKGHFLRCLNALRDVLGENEIFFGFPNKNSVRGFEKLGWTNRGVITTRVRVIPGAKVERFGQVSEIGTYGEADDEFFARLVRADGPLLERTAPYLTWRYKSHPGNSYSSYELTEDGKRLGVVVLRDATVKGRRLAIVMELLSVSDRAERQLVRFAAAWARRRGVWITLVLNNTLRARVATSSGFLALPAWILPKRQVLMGAATGEAAERVWQQRWRVQMGDWDSF
jgi:GNAT superfamily N-acetyltransferase